MSRRGVCSQAGPVEIVDIFRRSEFVPEIVEAAIGKGANLIWMQEGVVHEDARRKAESAEIAVVMDHYQSEGAPAPRHA